MTHDRIDQTPHAGVVMTGDDGLEGPKAFYILIEARPAGRKTSFKCCATFAPASRTSLRRGPWYGVRHSPAQFAIFEAFPNIARRNAHVAGKGGDIFRCRTDERNPRASRPCSEGRHSLRKKDLRLNSSFSGAHRP
jgi:hypothetical protein